MTKPTDPDDEGAPWFVVGLYVVTIVGGIVAALAVLAR
jgi:hypothetical protein